MIFRQHRRLCRLIGCMLLTLVVGGCQAPAASNVDSVDIATPASAITRLARITATSKPAPTVTLGQPPTLTIIPSATVTATPRPTETITPSVTPTASLTPTPIGPCSQRMPTEAELLTLVSQHYGLSRDYVPNDLESLNGYVSSYVTRGLPVDLRAIAIPSLVSMLADMEAAGLQPFIISGYRSYAQQAIARAKWTTREPERVDILSARPGHSEHQLGTTVDFGSPELADIVGDPLVEFHTYFYQTSEGSWLAENAARYGWTLSYTVDSFAATGLYYEPWHFRYVGVEMAQLLQSLDTTLTVYLLTTQPPPCIPD